MKLKKITAISFFCVIFYLSPLVVYSQISSEFYSFLQDSLKPKDRNDLTIKEASLLLNKNMFLDQRFKPEFNKIEEILKKKLTINPNRNEQILGYYALTIYEFNLLRPTSVINANLTKLLSLIEKNYVGYEKELFNAKIIAATVILFNEQNHGYENAIIEINSALKLKNVVKDKRVIPSAFKLLSNIYKKLNQTDSSIYNLIKADRFSIKTSENYLKSDFFFINQSIASNYLCLYYEKNRDNRYLDSVSKYVLKIKQNKNLNGRWLSENLSLSGYLNYAKGNYKQALLYADSALAISFDVANEPIIKTHKIALKSFALIKLGDTKKGINLLENQEISDDDTFYKSLILKTLSEAYKNTGDFKAANKYLQEYIKFQETENIMQYRGIVFTTNQKLATTEKENIIAKLKSEALFKKKENEFIIFVSLGLICLGFLFLYYRFRINRIHTKRKEILYAQKISLMDEQLIQQDIKINAEKTESALNERISIGKNLHDNLSGSLIALKYLVQDKRKTATKEESHILDEIKDEIETIYTETRNFSHILSKKENNNEVYIFNIETYLTRIKQRFDDLDLIKINTVYDKEFINKFPPVLSNQLYNFIKECLSNIIKHSEATEAWVSIQIEKHSCIIIIKDNGTGFNTKKTIHGIGIKNYTSTIENLNGELIIKSSKKGTTVKATIPLK
ncbi:ATP-binding protein [Pedobacter punctiformis]|uniref:histidine kinase n=1 Tax=Pedobacter punctiformis TaxID=3004097 RepID=A0ABT4L881_9SPHI|nr:ATP-binding protein [Pedobacter sp. HCMS5-2]MCZ4244105.1 hypothetical protein [Pedobacter sp. HCMS5-2]